MNITEYLLLERKRLLLLKYLSRINKSNNNTHVQEGKPPHYSSSLHHIRLKYKIYR